MKIQEAELERRKEIHEYLTTTHMFCLFVMMFALVLSKNLFNLKSPNAISFRFLLFFFIALLGFAFINKYNNQNASLSVDARITWVDLLYITFPLAIATLTLFMVGKNNNSIEVIMLLPVIIAASVMGKKTGIIMAVICTGIIYLENFILGTSFEVFVILQQNLIIISVMFIVAWFSGAQTDLDTQYRRELTKLASTDFLTGLYNFGYFQEKIGEYFQNASDQHPLALIILDVDYFKHYNDIHGHQAGDLLLSVIGDVLTEKVGHPGFVARYGGDEFVVVLPDVASADAKRIAEEISEMIKSQKFQGEEYQPEGKITISCGIAVCPTHALNPKDLIKHADQALYRAKSLDRNKVEMYFSVFDELDVEGDEKELLNSIRTLVSVINAKDRYTYGHSERVTDYAIKLGNKLYLPQEQIHLLGYAAFLHDIGKIEIDRDLLNKVGPLNKEEWETLKCHSQWGSDIVKAVKKLHLIVPIILYHHENYDGTGYPTGLAGKETPILARIIRIVDSYDAMISRRPYKNQLALSTVLEELRSCAGTKCDPELVDLFCEIILAENTSYELERK